MTTVGVAGLGAAGLRAARALSDDPAISCVALESRRPAVARQAVEALVDRAAVWAVTTEPTVVVLAGESGPTHVDRVRAEIRRGRSVVSLSAAPDDVDALLDLDGLAAEREVTLAVGAAFSPGLSCVLARHAASMFTEVTEIRTAFVGAGGPRCADARRAQLGAPGKIVRDGDITTVPAGSSTELTWLPDPISGTDCSFGGLSEPVLLQRAFPEAAVIEARAALTPKPLIELAPWRSSPPDGDPGAIRVEVVGRRDGELQATTYGVLDRPAVAAGITAGVVAAQLVTGTVPNGAFGLAEFVEPVPFLTELRRRGIRAATVQQRH